MRKLYFLLSLLFPIATMMTSSRVSAQTDAEYEAALAAIQDGAQYYITTEYEGYKYYLTADGNLQGVGDDGDVSGCQLFTFLKTAGEYKPYGFRVYGTTYFSNPNSSSSIDDAFLHTNGDGRTPWEVQIFYLGENGKYAVRATACNSTTDTSGWNWCGSAFWTVNPGPAAGYSFDVNYIWSLETPTDLQQVKMVLDAIYDAYESYIGDEDGYQMNMVEEGAEPEFGQRRDWDTYRKFLELMDYVDSILTEENLGGLSLEDAEALKAQADSLYNVVIESEQPYTLPEGDGYYRIISPLRYISEASESGYVDKAMLASYDPSTANYGAYGTILRDHANFVWKLEQHGDSIAIENVGMENYISFSSASRVLLTQDIEDASHVVFDYAGEDYVDADDGNGDTKNLFYIRLASKARNASNYMHQLNHNKGRDSGQDLVLSFWAGTYEKGSLDNESDRGTSEWYLEYVPESEVEELISTFAATREHDLLVIQNNLLRSQVAAALATAKESKMITVASQMTSPFSCDNFGYTDGGTLAQGVLIDGDKESYWHTDYKGNTPEGVAHYVQLSNMKDMVGECEFYICDRNTTSGNWPMSLTLYGSNEPDGDTDDAEKWTEIVVFDDLATGAGVENTRSFTCDTPYEYVRIAATAQSFWHAAEIQITTGSPRPSSQYVALGEVASTLDALYNENISTDNADITQEMYDALKAAYDAFMAEMVDPIELRSVMDTYSKLTESVIQGTNPGEWADTGVATDYNNLFAEIEAYDKAGKYSASQNHKYAVMLKAMAKSVLEKANVIESEKWYRIMVPTEEMYDAYGFSKDGVDKTGLREDQATVYGTFAAVAKEISEDVYLNPEDTVTTSVNHLENVVKDGVREETRMFFMTEDEIEDKDVSMFRFVEREAENVDYAPLMKDVKENINMAIDMSTLYNRGAALITDATQFSSNASCLNNDGQSLESGCLLDGNVSTYWHTDYQQQILAIPYLQVALKEPVSGLVQVEIGRRSGASNGHVVRMYVQGSTDAQTWSNIGYIETPYSGNTSEIVSSQPLDLGGTFSNLRFILTYRYGTDGGGNMEFDPFAEVTGVADWNKKWSYFHCSEFQIYPLTPKNEVSAEVQALQQAYNAANKVVMMHATAEDLSAAAQVYKSYQTQFNTEAGMAVLPAGKEKADPVYAIQNKATGLFIYAYGSNSNDVYLRTIPTMFDWTALGYSRNLLHGTNLNGDNCTNLHVGETNRRVCTWSSTEATSNSGLIICAADEEYAAPTEFTFYRDIKPGKIHAWTSSVTVTPEAKDDAVLYTCLGRFNNLEGVSFLAMKAIESVPAGNPAVYIYGDTTRYDSETDDIEPVLFTMPGTPDFVTEEVDINGLISCVKNHTLQPNEIYFSGNHPVCIGTTGYFLRAGGVAVNLDTVTAVESDDEADFLIALGEAGDKADGVETVLEKVSQSGNVYSIDGKLLMTGANLNSLKTLGRGMYILNGVKVYVK